MNSDGVERRAVLAGAGLLAATPAISFAAEGEQKPGAVLHIFAFRFVEGVTAAQKAEAVTRIRALQGKIPGLLETYVGVNFSPRGQGYELGGAMKFESKAALEAYGPHPEHQALLRWLMPLILPIEVDIEF